MYTETRISSRLEAATALLLLLVQDNRNTITELTTSKAEIVQAEPATLKMTPAYKVVARRSSNTEIIGYRQGPLVPGRRQIARHDSSVPGGEIARVVRTPETRSPPRHASTFSVAPQLPILACSCSTSPLNQTSLSEAMDKAFQDISKEAGQATQEEDDDVINGRASTLQPSLVGIKKGLSSPTVPLRNESRASTMRRESNNVLQNSLPEEARHNRFVWTRFTPSRQQPPDRVRRRSHYWRASDLSVTRSKRGDISPPSALAVLVAAAAAAQNSASSSSDTASATTVNAVEDDTDPEQQQQRPQYDLYSLLLRAQATETALMEG